LFPVQRNGGQGRQADQRQQHDTQERS
jgi:hypothetical protein